VSSGGWERLNSALHKGHEFIWMPRMLWGKHPKEDTFPCTGAKTRASGAWVYAVTPESAGAMIKHGTPVTTHPDTFLNVATELSEIRKPLVFNPKKKIHAERAVRQRVSGSTIDHDWNWPARFQAAVIVAAVAIALAVILGAGWIVHASVIGMREKPTVVPPPAAPVVI